MALRKSSLLKMFLRVAVGLILVTVLGLGGCLCTQRWAAEKAMRSREQIEATLSAQESYTPPLEDPISSERLKVFLAVRAGLSSYCQDFTQLRSRFDIADARAASFEGSEEPPPGEEMLEGAREFGAVARSMVRASSKLNSYGVRRNELLLGHRMGLGEFTFINVVACFSARGETPAGFFSEKTGARVWEQRVAGQVADMVGRHTALLEKAMQEASSGAERDLLHRRLRAWRQEQNLLVANPGRPAFLNTPPEEIRVTLDSFVTELQELCCTATSELDLARVVESNRIWYDHE